MKRRITKIKVKKGVYFFGWEIYQDATRNWDEHTLTCKDHPRDEFFLAIKNMVRHVMDICEFPKEEDSKKFIVSGITESYTEDNRFLTITAQKELSFSRAPLIVNTPARAEEVGADGDPAFCMSEDLLVDLGTLEDEAWKYIAGERAQQQLDFAEKAEHEDAAGGKDEMQLIGA